MRNLVKGLVLAGVLGLGMVIGAGVNKPVEKVVEVPVVEYVEKNIVAHQVASDGEMQVTYNDGTSETLWISHPQEKVDVELSWYQEGTEQEVEGFYLDDGDLLTVLTDGSYIICNGQQNFYMFQPVDLGDWDYTVNNIDELDRVVRTYISMKNTGMY